MSAERNTRPTNEEIAAELAEHPIVRFTMQDMPKWGVWLLGRLEAQWPQFRREMWPGKLAMLSGNNDFLFIHNDRAIILVGAAPRVMDGKLVLIEQFAWSKDAVWNKYQDRPMIPHKTPEERPLILLYRRARMWAQSMKAERLFIGQCSDMMCPRIKDVLQADPCNWVSVRM